MLDLVLPEHKGVSKLGAIVPLLALLSGCAPNTPERTFVFPDGFRGVWNIYVSNAEKHARTPIIRFNAHGVAYISAEEFKLLSVPSIETYKYAGGAVIPRKDQSQLYKELSGGCDQVLGIFFLGSNDTATKSGPVHATGFLGSGCDYLTWLRSTNQLPTGKRLDEIMRANGLKK